MEEKVRTDMYYYEFLYNIQIISQESHFIQRRNITQVFENYDVCRFINELDMQIERLDNLLSI
ncbi:MAG: hypothetical protein ACFFAI_10330 [Promethearchaeota archaeon]